ncbi:MAG: GRAM domain-containing protein [Bacteroidales bacterium]
MKVDLKPNEVVVKASNSQCIKDDTKVNGKLILTNQRVYFKNPQDTNSNLEIMPNEIEEIIYFSTKMLFSNGLNIITKDGRNLKFKVKQRDSWGKAINKMY